MQTIVFRMVFSHQSSGRKGGELNAFPSSDDWKRTYVPKWDIEKPNISDNIYNISAVLLNLLAINDYTP